MKKCLFILTVVVLFILGACSTDSGTDDTTSSSVKEYETYDLTIEDVSNVLLDDDLDFIYDLLGAPLKEWDTDFIYDELSNAILRDEYAASQLEESDADLAKDYLARAERGVKASEIKKMTMLQYTYSNSEGNDETFLIWISPRTDKVVYFSARSYMDEEGESTDDSLSDVNTDGFSIGEAVPFVSEDGYSIEVTMDKVSKVDGNDTYKPQGSFFAKVEYTIKNTGSQDFNVSADYLEFYDSDNSKSEMSEWDFLTATIPAGESITAVAYFDVINDGKNFKVLFAGEEWSGSYE